MPVEQYDLIAIGSGPGGYVAAIKAAKLGMKTALIENREIGGTCLNRGCIPTKTLMHSSHLYTQAKNLQELGIHFTGLTFDMNQIKIRKEAVVDKIRQGIVSLLRANGVTLLNGTATILRKDLIHLKTEEEEKELETGKILIATGSKPIIPKIEGVNLPNVVTSDEILSLQREPYRKLLIIGGGVIGIEIASIYRDFGFEVEIIEAMDRILPGMDKEISQSIAMSLKKKGINIHTKAKVVKISRENDDELNCEYEEKETSMTTSAEGILLCVGRKANTEGLFGPDLSVDLEGPHIKVNSDFETSVEGIYAIGDVIKGKQLAHAASAQGIAAVERMCNREISIRLDIIPSCIYTNPEVAVVGMDEVTAQQNGYSVKVGKYPMLGNAKTLLAMGERGFIKVIGDANTNRILGAQLLCDRATDMIGEFTTAISNGLTVKDLARVIRPHPTYAEAVTEAVEDTAGMAIHLMPKGR
jgi:dihydrolipoamide dehydrogenase